MSTEIRLSQEQLSELARQIGDIGHPCRFDAVEGKTLHRFCQSLENGGWAKWQSLLDFGGTLMAARKAGTVALVTATVAGVVAVIWAGFVAMIRKHGG